MIQHPLHHITRELGKLFQSVLVVVLSVLLLLRLGTVHVDRLFPSLRPLIIETISPWATVEHLDITWRGVYPVLHLRGVVVDPPGDDMPAIQIRALEVFICPLDSLVNRSLRVHTLTLDGVVFSLRGGESKGWHEIASVIDHLPINTVLLKNLVLNGPQDSHILWSLKQGKGRLVRSGSDLTAQLEGQLFLNDEQTAISGIFSGNTASDSPLFKAYVTMPRLPSKSLSRVLFSEHASLAESSPLNQGFSGLSLWLEGAVEKPQFAAEWTVDHAVPFCLAGYGFEHVDRATVRWQKDATGQWVASGHTFARTAPLGAQNADTQESREGQFALTANGDVITLTAEHMPIETLLLGASISTQQHQYELLQGMSVSGNLPSLKVQTLVVPNQAAVHVASGEFSEVTLSQTSEAIQLQGLAGTFDARPTEALVHLSGDAEYHHGPNNPQGAPQGSLSLQTLVGDIAWQKNDKGWQATVKDVSAQIGPGSLILKGNVIAAWDQPLTADLDVSLSQITTKAFSDALPLSTVPELVAWLSMAIGPGTLEQLSLAWHGPLTEAALQKQESTLHAKARIADQEVRFAEDWPALNHVSGWISFEGERIDVAAESARFDEHLPVEILVSIPSILDHTILIETHATLKDGDLTLASAALKKTALLNNLGAELENWQAKGQLDLILDLTIPLGDDEVSLDGVVTLKETTFEQDFAGVAIRGSKIGGKIHFTEHLVQSGPLTGLLFDKPLALRVDAELNSLLQPLVFHLDAPVAMTDIGAWLDHSPVLTGQANMRAEIEVPLSMQEQTAHFKVDSDLIGVTLEAPAPFGKAAEVRKPLRVLGALQGAELALDIQYESLLRIFQDFEATGNNWLLARTLVHLGNESVPVIPNNTEFSLTGTVPLLRTQEWLAWYARAFPVSGKTLATPPFVHLNVNAWQGPLFQWSDVQLQSQSDAHYWALECVSPDAKGKVAIPLGGKSGQPVYATFDTLVLSGLNTEDSLSSWRPAPAAWPIHVSVQELRWKESNFQDIKAKLLPIQDGWKLQNVSVQNGDITGQLQGVWHSQAADDRIALEGTCVVKNIAHTLASFNLDTAIRDASGNFQWHVAWSGGMSPKLSTIEGTAQATMRKGRILGFEPGIGRILGLLSVSNIQRRLTLDFRDITKKGFSFDEINGKVDFEQGWVKTDKLSLKGPIANLIFTGHGELGGKRQLEAEMLVSPQVSGTLPLAATLASGNPAVGIAVWVFNKVLSKEVNEMMQYRYAIAGTWDAPTMKELEIVPENKATHKQK